MPKITFEESEQYNQGGSFFGLSDDGDTAQVNFLLTMSGISRCMQLIKSM